MVSLRKVGHHPIQTICAVIGCWAKQLWAHRIGDIVIGNRSQHLYQLLTVLLPDNHCGRRWVLHHKGLADHTSGWTRTHPCLQNSKPNNWHLEEQFWRKHVLCYIQAIVDGANQKISSWHCHPVQVFSDYSVPAAKGVGLWVLS